MMAVLSSSILILSLLAICGARPQNSESNDIILEVLKENGVDPAYIENSVRPQPDPTTPTTSTTTQYPTPSPPITTPYPYTTTPTTTTSTTTPSPPPPYTTTTTGAPPLKLIKKKVITIEDWEADSEL